MISIPEEKRAIITSFLNSYKCPKVLTGYTILLKVIHIATEDPKYADDINCEEIFRDYVSKLYPDENNGSLWKANYRAARYCIIRSEYEATDCGRYSIPEFIQNGREYVHAELLKKNGRPQSAGA